MQGASIAMRTTASCPPPFPDLCASTAKSADVAELELPAVALPDRLGFRGVIEKCVPLSMIRTKTSYCGHNRSYPHDAELSSAFAPVRRMGVDMAKPSPLSGSFKSLGRTLLVVSEACRRFTEIGFATAFQLISIASLLALL